MARDSGLIFAEQPRRRRWPLFVLAAGLVLLITAVPGVVLANRGLVFYPWLFWPAALPVCLAGLALFALLPLLVQGKEWLSCRWSK